MNPANGWVEVCIREAWGSICNQGLGQAVAVDVCTKANFSGEGMGKVLNHSQCHATKH